MFKDINDGIAATVVEDINNILLGVSNASSMAITSGTYIPSIKRKILYIFCCFGIGTCDADAVDSFLFIFIIGLRYDGGGLGHEVKSLGYGGIGGHDARSDVYDCEGYHEAMI